MVLFLLLIEQIVDCFYMLSLQSHLFALRVSDFLSFRLLPFDQINPFYQLEVIYLYCLLCFHTGMLIVKIFTNILHALKVACGGSLSSVYTVPLFFLFFDILVQNFHELNGSYKNMFWLAIITVTKEGRISHRWHYAHSGTLKKKVKKNPSFGKNLLCWKSPQRHDDTSCSE